VPPRHAAPIRRRLTVLQDGTTESTEIVFCEARLRSVEVSRCEACPFAGVAKTAERDACVDCGRTILSVVDEGEGSGFPPAVAASLPVGLALVQSLVCVEEGLSCVEMERTPILRGSRASVPVVDHAGALVGVLPAPDAAPGGHRALPEPLVSVAQCAVSVASVHEAESLGDAFVRMGAHHARELPVVGDGRRVVGVLRDVEALRFVAYVARTGQRPPHIS
jgi:CBS domain-containing protein